MKVNLLSTNPALESKILLGTEKVCLFICFICDYPSNVKCWLVVLYIQCTATVHLGLYEHNKVLFLDYIKVLVIVY